jgi:hypothetical protein
MRQLVDRLAPVVLLAREATAERLEDRGQPLGRFGRQRLELREPHGALQHGEQLHRGELGRIETSQLRGDPLGERLGQRVQDGCAEVPALVEESVQEPDGEERVAARPIRKPTDERVGDGGAIEERAREVPHRLLVQGPHIQSPQHALLLQAEHDVGREEVVGQLQGPGRGGDEDRDVGQIAGEVVQGVQRRRVREVHVVEHHDDGAFRGDPLKEHSEGSQHSGTWRLRVGMDGDAGNSQDAGEVVLCRFAQRSGALSSELAEMTLERLDPEAEGGRRSKRVGPCPQLDQAASRGRQELLREPCLPDAGIARYQDATELAGPGSPQLTA